MNKKTIFFTSIIVPIVIILLYQFYQQHQKLNLANTVNQNQPNIINNKNPQTPKTQTGTQTPKLAGPTPNPTESTPKPVEPKIVPSPKSEKSINNESACQEAVNEFYKMSNEIDETRQKEKQREELHEKYRPFCPFFVIIKDAEIIKTTNPTTNKRIDKIICNDGTKTKREYIFEYDEPEIGLITSKRYINNEMKQKGIYDFKTKKQITEFWYIDGKIDRFVEFDLESGNRIKDTIYRTDGKTISFVINYDLKIGEKI